VVVSAAFVCREYVTASENIATFSHPAQFDQDQVNMDTAVDYFDHSQPLDSNPRESGMLSLSHVFSFACLTPSHHLSHAKSVSISR
jgi:hypothetical protein